jgi:hypothetical protein
MKKIILTIAFLFFATSPAFAGFTALPSITSIESEGVTNHEHKSVNCEEQLVLGYFFKNNKEPAIITRDGDILFNPNHNMEIFVEVCLGISEVKIGHEDNFVDLHYDSETALWFGIVPNHLLEDERNSLSILVGENKLTLVDILNVKMFEKTVGDVFQEYEIYSFSGYKWEKIEYSEDEMISPIFSLPSGRYYARLRDENTWFYSPIVDLSETTIVSLSYGERNFPVFFHWLAKYFSPLEQEFFNSSYSLGDSLIELSIQDFYGIEAYGDFGRNTLFMYMNRWNPLYEKYLEIFESNLDNYDIILFTDGNNLVPLQKILLDFDENIELYRVEGGLLESLVVRQPKIYFYGSDTEEILGFFRAQDLNILK